MFYFTKHGGSDFWFDCASLLWLAHKDKQNLILFCLIWDEYVKT